MSDKPTKFKIDLNAGTIEIEGSEDFVKTTLDEYKEFISSLREKSKTSQKTKPEGKSPKKGRAIKTPSFTPISIDLKAGDDHPSLRDFYTEKQPKTNLERNTLFIYYLNKWKNLQDIQPGHILSCYDEVGVRKPRRPDVSLYDTSRLHAWIEPGSITNSYNIAIAGENLVEHDLPRKKND